MAALIENGLLIKEDEVGSTLLGDGETGADEFGSYFKPARYIAWDNDLGLLHFTSMMSLVIAGLEDSGAYFAFNTQDSNFGLVFINGNLYLERASPRKACFPDMMLLAYGASSALITSYIPTFTCNTSLCLPITCSLPGDPGRFWHQRRRLDEG